MAISVEDQQRVIDALRAKAPNMRACSICGVGPWSISGGFAAVTVTDEAGKLVLGGQNLPLVPLVCANCGQTVFFNLLVLGLSDLLHSATKEEAPNASG